MIIRELQILDGWSNECDDVNEKKKKANDKQFNKSFICYSNYFISVCFFKCVTIPLIVVNLTITKEVFAGALEVSIRFLLHHQMPKKCNSLFFKVKHTIY